MTYDAAATLMQDFGFRGRIKVAALKYADAILAEPVTTIAHTSRLKWALGCEQNADMVAMQLQSLAVLNPAVQEAGAAVTDEALQSVIESVAFRLM